MLGRDRRSSPCQKEICDRYVAHATNFMKLRSILKYIERDLFAMHKGHKNLIDKAHQCVVPNPSLTHIKAKAHR